MSSNIEALKERYAAAGQSHVFTFWDSLSSSEQESFAEQLSKLDVERVNAVHKKALEADALASQMASSKAELGPPPAESTVSTGEKSSDSALEKELRDIGLKAIADGQAGVLLMAGGQGTRLGSSAPKGCYDIKLPSHKSLFQIQAERIRKLQSLAEQEHKVAQGKVVIPWYIMTSGPTRKPTEEFFKANNFFGLEEKNVIFFEQGGHFAAFTFSSCYITETICSQAPSLVSLWTARSCLTVNRALLPRQMETAVSTELCGIP